MSGLQRDQVETDDFEVYVREVITSRTGRDPMNRTTRYGSLNYRGVYLGSLDSLMSYLDVRNQFPFLY